MIYLCKVLDLHFLIVFSKNAFLILSSLCEVKYTCSIDIDLIYNLNEEEPEIRRERLNVQRLTVRLESQEGSRDFEYNMVLLCPRGVKVIRMFGLKKGSPWSNLHHLPK